MKRLDCIQHRRRLYTSVLNVLSELHCDPSAQKTWKRFTAMVNITILEAPQFVSNYLVNIYNYIKANNKGLSAAEAQEFIKVLQDDLTSIDPATDVADLRVASAMTSPSPADRPLNLLKTVFHSGPSATAGKSNLPLKEVSAAVPSASIERSDDIQA